MIPDCMTMYDVHASTMNCHGFVRHPSRSTGQGGCCVTDMGNRYNSERASTIIRLCSCASLRNKERQELYCKTDRHRPGTRGA